MTISRLLYAAAALAIAAPMASALPPSHSVMSVHTPPDTAVTSKFDVDGVTVILRHNPANEVIAANLYLLGGARQVTPANAGIEALILLASERGTKRFPGARARQHDLHRGE